MPFFAIDKNLCDQDGLCVKACPTQVIQMNKQNPYPAATQDYAAYCLACGHCVAVCPTGAFSMDQNSVDLCPPIQKELTLTPEQAEQFLRSRRSIRNFRKQPVERFKLEKLMEMACCAPSAKNSQPWHWTVVADPADVRRLAEMVVDWIRGITARFPEKAEISGFPRIVSAWDAGEERICRGAPHLLVVHGDKDYGFGAEDSALALSYLELFAPALGLGTCWGGYVYSAINAHAPLFKALGLPSDHRALGAMMVGYPKLRYLRLPNRNAPKVTWR